MLHFIHDSLFIHLPCNREKIRYICLFISHATGRKYVAFDTQLIVYSFPMRQGENMLHLSIVYSFPMRQGENVFLCFIVPLVQTANEFSLSMIDS